MIAVRDYSQQTLSRLGQGMDVSMRRFNSENGSQMLDVGTLDWASR